VKVLRNNFYMLKLMFEASPKLVILSVVSEMYICLMDVIYSLVMFPLIVEALQGSRTFSDVVIFLLIYLVLSVICSILSAYTDDVIINREGMAVQHYLMRKIYNKAINADLSCYENPEFYDNYTKANAEIIDRFYEVLYNITWICGGIVSIIATVTAIIIYEPIIFFIVIIPVILERLVDSKYTLAKFNRNKETTPYSRRMDYVSRIVYLQDYAKDLRLSSIFGPLMKNFNSALDMTVKILKQYGFKIGAFRFLKTILTSFIVFFGVQSIIVYKFLKFGAYTLAGVTRLINASSELTSLLGNLSWMSADFYQNGMFIENLKVFLEYEPKLVEEPNGKLPENKEHTISIKDVSFSYEGAEKPVLEHISIEIQPKQKIALVGHNGAGKSTLVKLLMRLYDVTDGEIELDGINIKDYKLSEYRHIFGTVFQDFKIFAMSVAENVLLREANTPEDVQKAKEALKSSGIYSKVETFEKGMDTLLTKEFSEDGVIMSGGEFQKLAVARVFAKESSVAILDEPSSALDPISEYEMFESMMKACEDKTVIFVSHRLSSAVMADKIYMLENGRIIEEGSHHELMELDGKYAEMFKMQAEKYRQEQAAV